MKKYGINKVHYSLATLKDKLEITLKFNLLVDSNSQFMAYVDSIPNLKGGADLAKALEDSPSMFTEENGGRPTAKKILVVVIDSKSDSSENDIEDAVSLVEDTGIRVIPVGLDQADKTELQTLTLVEEDVLTPSKDETPEDIAKDIMDRALNGERMICRMMINNFSACLCQVVTCALLAFTLFSAESRCRNHYSRQILNLKSSVGMFNFWSFLSYLLVLCL